MAEEAKTTARVTRVAVLTKGPLLAAFIALIVLDTGVEKQDGGEWNVVGSLDPRCSPPNFKHTFPTAAEAGRNYTDALALSRDRGWTIAHTGERNFG